MIILRSRSLIIPNDEYNLGNDYDTNTATRVFQLDRVMEGIDLANLMFKLDLTYADGTSDTLALDSEVTDDKINLTWTVTKNQLHVPGTVVVQIRALNVDGNMKWTSYIGAFFVEASVFGSGVYSGKLSEIEQFESALQSEQARVQNERDRQDTEAARVRAEEARANAENERWQTFNTNEEIRKSAENTRNTNETQRQEAETQREEWYNTAKSTYESSLASEAAAGTSAAEAKKYRDEAAQIVTPDGLAAKVVGNTEGISKLKEDLGNISDYQDTSFEIGGIKFDTGDDDDETNSLRTGFLKVSNDTSITFNAILNDTGTRVAVFKYDKYKNFVSVDNRYWMTTLPLGNSITIDYDYVGYTRFLIRNHSWRLPDNGKYISDYFVKNDLFYEYILTPEMFGAVGDGIADDTEAIIAMFEICKNKTCVLNGKYKLTRYITISDKVNFIVEGNGTILGYGSNNDKSDNNSSLITFLNCDGFEIRKITVNSQCDWVERPYGWEESHADYISKREKSYNALKFSNCNNFVISDVTDKFCETGFFISGCKNGKIINCSVFNTLADGCFVTGSSNYITVYGLYGENIGDDFLSADGYSTDSSLNPKYITFDHCKVINGYGSLTCLEGCSYCSTVNCYGYNIQYTPIKFGELKIDNVTAPASNIMIKNNYITCKNKIQGATYYSSEDENYSYCGGHENIVETVSIEDNIIISDLNTNNQWNFSKIRRLTFRGNKILGFNLIFENSIYLDIIDNWFNINNDKYMIFRINNTARVTANRFICFGNAKTCIMLGGENLSFVFSGNDYAKSDGSISNYVTLYSSNEITFNDKGLYVPITDIAGKIKADAIFLMSVNIKPSAIKNGQLVLRYDNKLGFINDGEFVSLGN